MVCPFFACAARGRAGGGHVAEERARVLQSFFSMWRGVLACGLAVLAGPVLAQAGPPTLAPSPALQCLTPAVEKRGEPAYPDGAWMGRRKGSVQVQIQFTAPDAEPVVTALKTEGGADFEAAVRAHVRTWRVPCMVPGQPVSLLQTYVFDPAGRSVFWGPTQDRDDEVRTAQLACLSHVSGQRAMRYPLRAERERLQGRVVASMRFTAPDRPPVVTVHHRPSVGVLGRAVQAWAEGFRLPCLTGEAVSTHQTFVFLFDGDTFGFKPPLLQQVLLATKGIRQQSLQLDTHTMGCPFQVKFAYRQPYLPNEVGSLDQADPARESLLRWLRSVEFDLPDNTLDSIYADDTTITVPCMRLNLKPEVAP
jgi:hypothetical protein